METAIKTVPLKYTKTRVTDKSERIAGYPDVDEAFFHGCVPANEPCWEELPREHFTLRHNSTVKYVRDIPHYDTVKVTYVHYNGKHSNDGTENYNPRRAVFFHGLNCVPESYSLFLNLLSQEFEILTFDNIAHGETSAPSPEVSRDEAYSADQFVNFAHLVLQHEGWLADDSPKFYVIGHSMGGELSLIVESDKSICARTEAVFAFTPAGIEVVAPLVEGFTRSCFAGLVYSKGKKMIYNTIEDLAIKNNFVFFPDDLIDYHKNLSKYYMGAFEDGTSTKYVERGFYMSKSNFLRVKNTVLEAANNMKTYSVPCTVLLIEGDKYINSRKSAKFLEKHCDNINLIWKPRNLSLNHDICILHPKMAMKHLREAFGLAAQTGEIDAGTGQQLENTSKTTECQVEMIEEPNTN